MALQPIVNLSTKTVFAQEALVRGPNGEGAGTVLAQVNETNRYRFDQTCRIEAVRLGAKLGVESLLSINFLPNAVYRPEACLRTTFDAAASVGFPTERIMFEFSEAERIEDVAHVRGIIEHYKARGFKTAIDDFGAGYSGLNLLAELRTDFIKLDMALVRDIDRDRTRQAIVRGILTVCTDLAIEPIAEGVESLAEVHALEDLGIELFQGYYFARPAFQALATVHHPA